MFKQFNYTPQQFKTDIDINISHIDMEFNIIP
jgi:hypothetical protein